MPSIKVKLQTDSLDECIISPFKLIFMQAEHQYGRIIIYLNKDLDINFHKCIIDNFFQGYFLYSNIENNYKKLIFISCPNIEDILNIKKMKNQKNIDFRNYLKTLFSEKDKNTVIESFDCNTLKFCHPYNLLITEDFLYTKQFIDINYFQNIIYINSTVTKIPPKNIIFDFDLVEEEIQPEEEEIKQEEFLFEDLSDMIYKELAKNKNIEEFITYWHSFCDKLVKKYQIYFITNNINEDYSIDVKIKYSKYCISKKNLKLFVTNHGGDGNRVFKYNHLTEKEAIEHMNNYLRKINRCINYKIIIPLDITILPNISLKINNKIGKITYVKHDFNSRITFLLAEYPLLDDNENLVIEEESQKENQDSIFTHFSIHQDGTISYLIKQDFLKENIFIEKKIQYYGGNVNVL